ncbi:2TM domain-containing protein [Flavobacteriaceae bacterium S356]|uniref:2TM domain-containing protein n=1 Tax=Asprobacillus argus TaxID=3076534 RepID=A0ABU3LEI8_9FLAO|nr:2TM domain-containing protein [Flavobacteriaceae bacterium S356]
MNKYKDVFTMKNLKKGFIVCFKITLVFTFLFGVIFQEFSLEGLWKSFIISGLFSFGMGFGNGFINNYLNTKWDWIKQTNERVTAGIIATVLYTIPLVLGINYLILIVWGNIDPSNFFNGNNFWMHLFYIILSLGVSTFFHARGFMRNWKAAMSQETTKQEIVAKTETAKFESLKNQLDPHFLFNSLNVLTSLIGENPNQAEKFTTKLSKVYRYVLEQRNKDLIPLSEELQFARTYMELLGMRFEDAVKFTIPETVSNEELKIVPLSLQLLLENAVKHNVVSSLKPLEITIYEEEGYLIIQNNINPKEAIGKSTKVGLQNIADRYGLITSKGVKIENNNKIFKVCLPLLFKMNTIMQPEELENSKYVRAVERVEKLKEFYQNLASYVIVIPFLIFINLQFSPQFHWFWFPVFGWGFGVLMHGLDAYNYNIFLGKNWEEKKIKELMNQNNRRR